MDKKEILSICEKNNVKFIHLWFSDLFWVLKSVTIPIGRFEQKIEEWIWFDGSSIQWFARVAESDMYLIPDYDTFSLVPWESSEDFQVWKIVCDVYKPNWDLFHWYPRQILKNQVEEAKKKWFEYHVWTELEFYFVKLDEDWKPMAIDNWVYFDYINNNTIQIQEEIMNILWSVWVEIESFHHEVWTSQFEITLLQDTPIKQADDLMLIKAVLKAVARKYDLICTFMPKPYQWRAWSWMHIHQSLRKDWKNLFYDPKHDYNLSTLWQCFVWWQLKHSLWICLITNPLINSYKRLVTWYEAPIYAACWQRNRSVLIRIPWVKTPEKSIRCEIRCPDSSSNPYLVYAVLLASGLDWIKNKEKSPKCVDDNMFDLNFDKARRLRIKSLPSSLREAVKKFDTSWLVKKVFWEDICKMIVDFKTKEINEFDNNVSDWELKKYL